MEKSEERLKIGNQIINNLRHTDDKNQNQKVKSKEKIFIFAIKFNSAPESEDGFETLVEKSYI